MSKLEISLSIIHELLLVSFLLTILFFLGDYYGYENNWFIAGLAVYLCWHLYHLFKLLFWLNTIDRVPLPQTYGIWDPVSKALNQSVQFLNKFHDTRLLNDLRSFIEIMPDGAIILKENNQIEWFNKSAARYLSLKRKTHLGLSIIDIVKDEGFLQFLNNRHNHFTYTINSLNDKHISLSLRKLTYASHYRLILITDISEMHLVNQMRKDFIANVSHELRTPLTVITGYLETFEAHLQDQPLLLNSLKAMQNQSGRMQTLIEDLMTLSKMEGTDKEDISKSFIYPALIIREIIDEIQDVFVEKAHVYKLDIDEDLNLIANENDLRSIVINLISNAARYTEAKGMIKISWKIKKNQKCLSVKDNGIGIDSKHLSRLTERFYRVDKARSRNEGGSGLGLAIVKHGLNRNGGQLQIKSKPGKGSHFICCFSDQ